MTLEDRLNEIDKDTHFFDEENTRVEFSEENYKWLIAQVRKGRKKRVEERARAMALFTHVLGCDKSITSLQVKEAAKSLEFVARVEIEKEDAQ